MTKGDTNDGPQLFTIILLHCCQIKLAVTSNTPIYSSWYLAHPVPSLSVHYKDLAETMEQTGPAEASSSVLSKGGIWQTTNRLLKEASSARVKQLSEHSRLADHMHRIGLAESPTYQCGLDRQTARHIIMICPVLKAQRAELMNSIDKSFHINKTPVHRRSIQMTDIIASKLDRKTNLDILQAFSTFIRRFP